MLGVILIVSIPDWSHQFCNVFSFRLLRLQATNWSCRLVTSPKMTSAAVFHIPNPFFFLFLPFFILSIHQDEHLVSYVSRTRCVGDAWRGVSRLNGTKPTANKQSFKWHAAEDPSVTMPVGVDIRTEPSGCFRVAARSAEANAKSVKWKPKCR